MVEQAVQAGCLAVVVVEVGPKERGPTALVLVVLARLAV
jgi:hypothetical protein